MNSRLKEFWFQPKLKQVHVVTACTTRNCTKIAENGLLVYIFFRKIKMIEFQVTMNSNIKVAL